MFLIALSVAISVHSLLLEWPDIKKMVQATMIMSLVVQCGIRFLLYLLNTDLPPAIYGLVLDKFEEVYQEKNETKVELLHSHVRSQWFMIRVIWPLHGLCQFGPLVASFLNFVWNGTFKYAFPFFLPFFPRDSLAGYLVNCVVHVILDLMHYAANPLADCAYFLCISQIKLYVDLIECDIRDFSYFLSSFDVKCEEDIIKLRSLLERIIESHRQLANYNSRMSSFIVNHFTVLICLNVYVICSSGVSFLTSEYYVAIGLIVLYPTQILFVCSLGAFVNHQHERLMTILWNFEWYELPLNEQKDFLFLMMNVQQPLDLCSILVGAMNMELFTTVIMETSQ